MRKCVELTIIEGIDQTSITGFSHLKMPKVNSACKCANQLHRCLPWCLNVISHSSPAQLYTAQQDCLETEIQTVIQGEGWGAYDQICMFMKEKTLNAVNRLHPTPNACPLVQTS